MESGESRPSANTDFISHLPRAADKSLLKVPANRLRPRAPRQPKLPDISRKTRDTDMKLIGLADCNNFFVSCERIFRPDLQDKPVVVLSSNDGCVVSRSNEAKALGIPMGAPYFRVEDFMHSKGVAVFSGNLRLYRNISRRVMAHLALHTDMTEQYSIDEAFFNLTAASILDPVEHCRALRRSILENCGIPVSIGISTTKTLCKLASETAKERSKKDPAYDGVCLMTPDQAKKFFPSLPLKQVWGMGRHSVKKLRQLGITTASQFLKMDDEWIQKNLTIRGLMTARELRGIPCFPLAKDESKQQSVQVTCSFGQRLTGYEEIAATVAAHAVEGAYRLRHLGQRAGTVGCSLRTSRFIDHVYAKASETRLSPPTSQDDDIVEGALKCLKKIYVAGYQYAKAGIYLSDLTDDDNEQMDLFDDAETGHNRQERLMKALDDLNRQFGENTIMPALLKCTESSEPRHILRTGWDPKTLNAILDSMDKKGRKPSSKP